MTTGASCRTCRFFNLVEDGDGYCRRYAPHAVHAGVVVGYGEADRVKWPVVKGDDWCGEWELQSADIEPAARPAVAPLIAGIPGNTPIDDFGLSTRLHNRLVAFGALTWADVMAINVADFVCMGGVGTKTLAEFTQLRDDPRREHWIDELANHEDTEDAKR